LRSEWIDPLLDRLSLTSVEDMYAAMGYGGIMTNQIIPRLKEKYKNEQNEIQAKNAPPEIIIHEEKEKDRIKKSSSQGILVDGIDDMPVRFAKCCSPVPGDNIIGYITRGRGVTIHRDDCPNFEKTYDSNNRFIEVKWDSVKPEESSYSTEIQVIAPDRKGLLGEVTVLITELNLFVTGVNAKLTKNEVAIINLTIEISSANQLTKLMTRLRNMKDIIEVKRVTT
ncbi:MAG: ACT domain-containing protein, partial [Acidaminobacteraceae bacterium]